MTHNPELVSAFISGNEDDFNTYFCRYKRYDLRNLGEIPGQKQTQKHNWCPEEFTETNLFPEITETNPISDEQIPL